MSYGAARARYTQDAAQTVSPGRLLTMLYDRLVTDLRLGEEAMRSGAHAETAKRLGNAQAILLELHGTLDVTAWDGGQALADLYVWMVSQLMTARTSNRPELVADCVGIVEPIRDAWHAAAGTAVPPASGAGKAPATTPVTHVTRPLPASPAPVVAGSARPVPPAPVRPVPAGAAAAAARRFA